MRRWYGVALPRVIVAGGRLFCYQRQGWPAPHGPVLLLKTNRDIKRNERQASGGVSNAWQAIGPPTNGMIS